MVVCKFFLQGNCKFGDNCNFEHRIPSGFGGGNVFASAGKSQNVDVNTLVKSVHNDMVALEHSGQWLLTCYAPFKEKPNFPDFEEHSFEEVRLATYQAQQNNTLDQYNRQLQQALQNARNKFMALKTPTKEITNILKNIYFNSNANANEPIKSNSVFGTSNFGSTNTNNIFGNTTNQPNNASSIFAKANQSIFNNSTAPSQNIFGAETKPNTTQNIFQQNSNSIFGNNQSIFNSASSQNSIFGGQASNSSNVFNTQNASIFNQGNTPLFGQSTASFGSPTSNTFISQNVNPATQNTSPFQNNSFLNQNNSLFNQNNPTPSVFGQNSTTNPQNSIFNQNPPATTSIFNQPAASGSIFDQNAQSNNTTQNPTFQNSASNLNQPSIFSQNTQSISNNTNSIFNQSEPTNSNQTPGFNQNAQTSIFNQNNGQTSIFGNNSSQGSIFGNSGQTVIDQPNPDDENVYSKLEDLTEEEINWFKSDDLDITKIPEKPPTYELCCG